MYPYPPVGANGEPLDDDQQAYEVAWWARCELADPPPYGAGMRIMLYDALEAAAARGIVGDAHYVLYDAFLAGHAAAMAVAAARGSICSADGADAAAWAALEAVNAHLHGVIASLQPPASAGADASDSPRTRQLWARRRR